MAYVTGGFALGLIFGPAAQAALTLLIGYPGWRLWPASGGGGGSGGFRLHMYNAPAAIGCVLSAALILLFVRHFRETYVLTPSSSTQQRQQKMKNERVIKIAPRSLFTALFV